MWIVYKTTQISSGMVYIGVHKTETEEFDGYLGSGKRLKHAIRKYGKGDFIRETLFKYSSPEEAFQKESELVNLDFINRPDTFNLVEGGSVPILFGESNGFYGKKHSHKTIQTLRERRLGSSIAVDVRSKISKSIRLKIDTDPEFAKKLSQTHHTDESRRKISESLKNHYSENESKNKGFKWSDEQKANALETKPRGENHYKFKGYYVTPFGKFSTFTDGANTIGLDSKSFLNRCIHRCDCKVVRVCKFINKSDIGKTWRELGWYYEQV